MRDLELEYEKLESAKRSHDEEISLENQRLTADKKVLKQLATEQANAASLATKQLKEEGERLQLMRRQISDEMNNLDSNRSAVS